MLVAVGLVTWAISGLWLWRHGLEPMLATVAWLVFPLPFVATTTGRVQGTPALALTALQALCAVTMGALTANLPASTLAIVAGQLPFLVRPRIAVAAAVLQLTVSASARALTVSARDDGGGARHYSAGNGLKGLAERMTELGGTLQVEPRPGAGFRLTASLPLGARS